MTQLGWEHEGNGLPGTTVLQSGQIRAVTASDGAGPVASLLAGQAWEPSAKTAKGREEAGPARDLLWLQRAVWETCDGDDAPKFMHLHPTLCFIPCQCCHLGAQDVVCTRARVR